MRFTTIAVALALQLACDPPIVLNEPPDVEFTNLVDGATINESPDAAIDVQVTDRDNNTMTVTVTDDVAGELGTFDSVASGDTVSVPIAGIASGAHTLSADVFDGTATTHAEIHFTWNLAPSAPTIAITPSNPGTMDDLQVSVTQDAVDTDGSMQIVYEYSWKLEGSGDTATGQTLSHQSTTKGDVWDATVRAWESSDGTSHADDAAFVDAMTSVTIGNTAPTAPVAVAIGPHDPLLVNDLRCYVPDPSLNGGTDVDPADQASLTYFATWTVNGGARPAYDGHEYLPASDLAPGQTWACALQTDDGTARSSAVASLNVLVGGQVRRAVDAGVRISGDNNNQHLGQIALGLDLDVESSGSDDELVLGIADYKEGVASGPAGLVAVYSGIDVSTSLISNRTYSLRGVTENWAVGGSAVRMPDAIGASSDDLAFSRHSVTGTDDGIVYVVPGDSIASTTTALTAPFGGLTLEGDAVDFGAHLGSGDIDGDNFSDLLVSDGPVVQMFSGDAMRSAGANAACADTSVPCLRVGQAQKRFGDDNGAAFDAVTAGDLDGDGLSDVLLTSSGSATDTIGWIYLGDSLQVGSLYALADADVTIDDDVDAGAQAGGAAAVLADSDGDGIADFAIGNPDHLANGTDPVGWAVLFRGSASLGTAPLALSAPAASIEGVEPGARFGAAVVSLGDLGGDGLSELAIAAPNATVNANAGAGVVYLFAGTDFTDASLAGVIARDADYARAQVTGEAAGDGLTVSGPPGDYDADGIPDITLGAPMWSSTDAGRAYIFITGR